MSNNIRYEVKTVILDYRGELVERVVKADLDRVYLTDRSGDLTVYYDAKKKKQGKHLFIKGASDNLIPRSLNG